jgi:hypothetical protein
MLPYKERLIRAIESCIDEIHVVDPDRWVTSRVISSLDTAILNHALNAVCIDLGANVISMIAGDLEIEISKKLLSYPGFVCNLSRLFQKMNSILGMESDNLKFDDLFIVLNLILTQEVEKKLRKLEKTEKFIKSFFSGGKTGSLANIQTIVLTRYILPAHAYVLTHKFAYTYLLSLVEYLKSHKDYVFKDFLGYLHNTYFARYDEIIEYSLMVRQSYIDFFKKTNQNTEEAIADFLKKGIEEQNAYLEHLYYYDKTEMIRLIQSHVEFNSSNSVIVVSEIEPIMSELHKIELSMRHIEQVANLLSKSEVIMELWRQLLLSSQSRNTSRYESVNNIFDYYSQILRMQSVPEYLLVNKEYSLIQLDGSIQALDAIIDTLSIIIPDGIITSMCKTRSYRIFLLCNLTYEVINASTECTLEYDNIKGLMATCLASSFIILTNTLPKSPLSEDSIKNIQQLSKKRGLYISDLINYGFDELVPISKCDHQISDKYIELIMISFSKYWGDCLKSLLLNDSSKYTIDEMAELLKEYDPVTSVENYIKSFSKYFD